MKLLQINSVANSGSTGRIAEAIGDMVKGEGWESFIAFGRYANKSSSNLIKIGSKLDNFIELLATRFLDRHGNFCSRTTKKFINQIEAIQPDIIHLHNIHGYFINFNILFGYLSKSKIPIVWTLHDCWSFTGHCAYFDFIGCEKWKTLCHTCELKSDYPKSFTDRSKENFLERKKSFTSIPINRMTLVPVSYWLSDLLNDSFLNTYSKKVIYNGINLNVFIPEKNCYHLDEKYKINSKKVILGVASVWSERKGLRDFVKLNEIINKDEFKIVLVGLSENEIKDLPNDILGIKKTESITELRNLYNRSSVFVNLTYEDNFPTTNLEALACGIPVITYNTGGSVESVSEDVGYIVEKGDINDVLNKINFINTGKIKRYHCRKRAEELYNKDDNFRNYLDIYNNLLSKKNI